MVLTDPRLVDEDREVGSVGVDEAKGVITSGAAPIQPKTMRLPSGEYQGLNAPSMMLVSVTATGSPVPSAAIRQRCSSSSLPVIHGATL